MQAIGQAYYTLSFCLTGRRTGHALHDQLDNITASQSPAVPGDIRFIRMHRLVACPG